MDFEVILGLLAFGLYAVIICAIVVAFILVSGFVATYLGLTGIMWWAVAIVVFCFLSGLSAMIGRIGQK